MEYTELYEMFKIMVKNSYNKGNIDYLKAIKETINLIPMYMVKNGKITLVEIRKLEDLIDTNIKMIQEI